MPTARLGLALILAATLSPLVARAASPSFVHGGQVTMCTDPT